jgi:hypothetical protein
MTGLLDGDDEAIVGLLVDGDGVGGDVCGGVVIRAIDGLLEGVGEDWIQNIQIVCKKL